MTACKSRGQGKGCAPLNQVLITDPASGVAESHASCSCGRRYSLSVSVQRRLLALTESPRGIGRASDGFVAIALDKELESRTWPLSAASALAKQGIVPIGTPVLHSPARPVPVITKGIVQFALHMMAAMRQADGIGLASNQVGVPLQVLVHAMPKIAPQVFLNPELLSSSGVWDYTEGCLSLKIDDTSAIVHRPKRIVVRANSIDGRTIVVRADEILARVLQHEMDHLNGIEYVQRLEGELREAVYELIARRGVDISCIPPRPYEPALRQSTALVW